MRQVSSGKYTIAWFKLAECVARGEREKALGVYRLLSHSIDDPAYALQLEGDIFWTFNDCDAAVEKYHEAALLYKNSQKYSQALSMWEHITLLIPYHIRSLEALFDLSLALKYQTKIPYYFELLYNAYESSHCYEKMLIALSVMTPHWNLLEQIEWYRKTTVLLIHQIPEAHELVTKNLRITIDLHMKHDNAELLSLFSSTVKAISNRYYQEIIWYLQIVSSNKNS